MLREMLPQIGRWSATSRTWLAKTVALLRAAHEEARADEARWVVGYHAGQLLYAVVSEAESLLPLLNDEDLDEALRRVGVFADALRDRELALKLENVAGRTPEEAEAFLAKAAELRARS
jgi:hypothetical protein